MKQLNLIIVIFGMFLFFSCQAKEIEEPTQELPEKESNHPFLIVKKEMYPALREKASQEPWKSMKADAISRSNTGNTSTDAYKLQEFVGASALAYILDEANSQTHANRVRDAIINQYSKLDVTEDRDWGGVVPNMSTFFVAILSLDIVYDALSIQEIQDCEKVISSQIFKINRSGSWVDARRGTQGTWDIYKGDRTTPDDDYYAGILQQITPDGVSPVTNHYAWERVGGGNSRISKSGYMDVLEFTGIDNRYYNNERIQKFQRWLFGSSVNCAKEMAIFGDMLPTQNLANDMLHRRVVNFDMEAAGYAAWFHDGTPAIGHILTYILPKQPLPEPVVPSSKIYENGGAFFREKEDDPNGLHAVLYNIKSQDEWHTHYEVNGLALSGLGNRLLVNGGRLGEPVRAAFLNNTLTINGENHKARIGGGIIEGFTSDELDYAAGFSGPALNEKHTRNLLLVHGADAVHGYFVVFDEVEASLGDKVKNYLHPANQTTISELASKEEYTAAIDHYPTVNGVKLILYYVTPPDEINIEKVQSAVPDRYPGYPDHNRVEAVYNTDEQGNKNLATVLFPFNSSNLTAVFQKITGESFNGCSLTQGDVVDFIFESKASDPIDSNGLIFQAEFCLARKVESANSFFFVRNGIHFSSGNTGFESDNPVTIYSKGKEGAIVSHGAKVKFTGAGMGSVKFDPAVEVLSSGAEFIEVQLPEGTFYF